MKSPWLTGFAILALAVGIGANTGVFSVVNALVLRSLPFRDPDHLVSLHTYLVPHGSARQFHDWRQQNIYLADAALFEQTDANLGNSLTIERAHLSQTSWNFFSVLGAQATIGRTFRDGEDDAGRNAIAVIGYGLWQQLFAGDTRVLGRDLAVNGTPLTIIGVMPPGFDYPGHTVIWKAADFSRFNNGWETVARLKPGVSLPQARAAFLADIARIAGPGKLSKKYPPQMISLKDQIVGPAGNASLLLMGGVLLILLIACSNVANLLLARTADRTSELWIRSALGASRGRLAQQLITECLLLSLAAAAAGLLLALWMTSLAAKVQPVPLGADSYSILDVRVLVFALLVATLSGLFFGLLPFLNLGSVHAFEARGSTGAHHSRLIRETLTVAQVAITIILLTAAASVGRAFVKLMQIDRGYNVKGLVTASVSLDGTTRQLPGRQLPYFEEALARLRRVPGVRDASETEFLPLAATVFRGGPVGFDGRPAQEHSMIVPVLNEYLRTMGARILYGRDFTPDEVQAGANIAVVSESFARQFSRPAEAVGHEVTFGERRLWRIIGVVGSMNYETDEANKMQIFVPAHAPADFSSSLVVSTFVVRVNGPAEDRLAQIRDAIRSVDAGVPVFAVKTMQQRLDDILARPRFYRIALLCFAGFALLLAVIGIYSAVSYAVVQRTREMGVRLALGSTPVTLRNMLLRQGVGVVAIGMILGTCGAMFTRRFLENLVYGAGVGDRMTFALSSLLILLIAAAGIWLATRPISRLDIMNILRNE